MQKGKLSLFTFFYGLTLCVVFAALIKKGVWMQADSGSYIDNHVLRSVLYPLVLDVYHLLVQPQSDSDYLGLVAVQIIAGIAASHYFSRYWVQLMQLPKGFLFLFTAILMAPYFLPTKIGNAVLTEALCYPLFLVGLRLLIKGMVERQYNALLLSLVCVVLLVITRGQFLFLYPLFAAVCMYAIWRFPAEFRKKSLCFFLLLACVLGGVIERGYHLLWHERFATTPFTGVHLSIAPLFVAKDEAKELFAKSTSQRRIFETVYQEMQEKDIAAFRSQVPYPGIRSSTYSRYHNGYDEILYGSFYPALSKEGILKEGAFYAEDYTSDFAATLRNYYLEDWFELCKKAFSDACGGDYMAILTLLLLGVLFLRLCQKPTRFSEAGMIIILAWIGNNALVSLIQIPLERYTLYVEGPFYVCIFSMIYLFLQKGHVYEQSQR